MIFDFELHKILGLLLKVEIEIGKKESLWRDNDS